MAKNIWSKLGTFLGALLLVIAFTSSANAENRFIDYANKFVRDGQAAMTSKEWGPEFTEAFQNAQHSGVAQYVKIRDFAYSRHRDFLVRPNGEVELMLDVDPYNLYSPGKGALHGKYLGKMRIISVVTVIMGIVTDIALAESLNSPHSGNSKIHDSAYLSEQKVDEIYAPTGATAKIVASSKTTSSKPE